jgi:thioredoxin 1
MAFIASYPSTEPTRAELEQTQGVLVVEFGASWCGICQAAQPDIAAALGEHSGIEHLKVGDGKGKPLGRSFRVKLWPTLIALRDGTEVARLVRPTSREAIAQMLASAVSS